MQVRPHIRRPDQHRSRSGLAPLELVLSLPILLLVMGLMIVIGWGAVFKVRTQTHAREAAWRVLWRANPRSDPARLANSPGFPAPAEMNADLRAGPSLLQGQPLALALFDAHPSTRGPVLVDPNTGSHLQVDRSVFELQDGLVKGNARMQRGFPLLAELPPRGYRFDVDLSVLDNRWQFWQQELSNNRSRRSLQLYPELAGHWQNLTRSQSLRFQQVAAQLRNDPQRAAMELLERDLELRSYYGSFRDYYPSAGGRTVAPQELQQITNRLIERISGRPRPRSSLGQAGVPGRLTRDFLNMYRDLLEQNPQLPLQPLIMQLEEFEGVLLN